MPRLLRRLKCVVCLWRVVRLRCMVRLGCGVWSVCRGHRLRAVPAHRVPQRVHAHDADDQRGEQQQTAAPRGCLPPASHFVRHVDGPPGTTDSTLPPRGMPLPSAPVRTHFAYP